ADADDSLRQFLLAETPAGFVELVRVLIAEVAVAGRANPVPVVVQPLPLRHDERRRAAPQVKVHPLRNRRFGIDEADAVALAITDRVGCFHRADLAAVNELECLPHAGHAATLHAHLADAAELAGPLRHDAAFLHVVAAGLFDVDIFAGLHRPHGHQG